MKMSLRCLFVGAALLAGSIELPAADGCEALVPISKYFSAGDTVSLSAWFGESVDISILSKGDFSSKSQARQMLKAFFDTYAPESFNIAYTSGNTNMKYAFGDLSAGGENFFVTVFLSLKGNRFKIGQIKIERRP